MNAGGDISVGVMGNMTALAGEKLGLFARTGPLSLQSGEGPVEMQAQNGSLQLAAQKKLTVTSVSDISFAGKKRIILIGGGSYLKLEAGNIEYGTEQVYLRRVERTYNAPKAATSLMFPENINYPFIENNKRIVSVAWSYGEDMTRVDEISRHYTDLNLHIFTENYSARESIDFELCYIDCNGDEQVVSITTEVGEDNEAIVMGLFEMHNAKIFISHGD